MNPHAPHRSSPAAALASVVTNWNLLFELTKRDVLGKYKGSWLGILWTILNPLALLGVYTFVFGVVMKVRWGVGSDDHTQFALVLFVGMLVHSFFSECVSKAPTLVTDNVTFVKKVVFPLEILPLSALLSALFHLFVALLVFLAAFAWINARLPITAILFPLTLLPAVLFTLGFTWFLSSIGVFFRDINQLVSLIVILFLFLSPVFYPVSALPPRFQSLIALNPLTLTIENGRRVLIFGTEPEWARLALQTLWSGAIAYLGFWWFQKTRKGFSDVV